MAKEGAITKEVVFDFGAEKGYDQDLFIEYLLNSIGNENGKLMVESYAISEDIKNIDDYNFREWFGNWMGFGNASYLPETHSYIDYTRKHRVYPYLSNDYSCISKPNEVNNIYVFRDDNLQFFHLKKEQKGYSLTFRSDAMLDLAAFEEQNVLAMYMVFDNKTKIGKIINNFITSLDNQTIKKESNDGTKQVVNAISGDEYSALIAKTTYYKNKKAASISMFIPYEETSLSKNFKSLYEDLDKEKNISMCVKQRINIWKDRYYVKAGYNGK